MSPSVIVSMALALPFSFEKMALFQHNHGLIKNYSVCLTVILGVIWQEQVVQHTMLVLVIWVKSI